MEEEDEVEVEERYDPHNLVIPPISPFEPLRPAQNNYVEHIEDANERPKRRKTAGCVVVPLVPEQLAYENLPCHQYRGGESDLPLYSLMYSIKTNTKRWSLLSMVIEEAIQSKLGWRDEDVPTFELYKRKHFVDDAEDNWQVLIQCKDAGTHYWLWKMGYNIESWRDEELNIEYTMKLIDEGHRAEAEILRADFILSRDSKGPRLPVDHEVAIRVAKAYNQHCHASRSANYPNAQDGIIGIWREQLERNWTDGLRKTNDLNDFAVGLWIDADIDRSNFETTLTDEETGLQFEFTPTTRNASAQGNLSWHQALTQVYDFDFPNTNTSN